MASPDERLDHVRTLLRRGRRNLDPATAARIRRGLDERLDERLADGRVGARRRSWLLGAAAVCVAVGVVILASFSMMRSKGNFEVGEIIVLSSGDAVELRHVRLAATIESRLRVSSIEPGRLHLVLASGALELEVESAEAAFQLMTPVAKIASVSARFSVVVDDRHAEIRVDSGQVEVTELPDGAVTRVVSGGRHRVERRKARAEREVPESGLRASKEPALRVKHRRPRDRPDLGASIRMPSVDSKREVEARKPRPMPSGKSNSSADERSSASSFLSPGPEFEGGATGFTPSVVEPRSSDRASNRAHLQKAVRWAPELEKSGESSNDPSSESRARIDSLSALPESLSPPVPFEVPLSGHEPSEVWVRRADDARRSGRLEEAAHLYERVADALDGGPFAEEALFRQAELLHRLGRSKDGLRVLARADLRFESGELAPERSALSARIHLALEDMDAARAAITRVPRRRMTLEIAWVVLDVARHLGKDRPCEALVLIGKVHDYPRLETHVATLFDHLQPRCRKSP